MIYRYVYIYTYYIYIYIIHINYNIMWFSKNMDPATLPPFLTVERSCLVPRSTQHGWIFPWHSFVKESLLVISAHLSEFLECNEGSSINLKPENCIPQHLTLATEECINVQRRSLISDSRIHHVFPSLDCHGVVPQRSVAVIYLTGPGNTVSRYISMSFVQLCWRSCKCDLLRI